MTKVNGMVPIEYLLNLLHEDAPFGDITSESVIPRMDCSAEITVEQPAVIAGLEEAAALFRHHGVNAKTRVRDGADVDTGDVVLSLHGDARAILMIERTALNIIGRMSGIASATREYVDRVRAANPACRVAATRKTAPGCRLLDKNAVLIGGGDPHRWTLSDGILIRDNHRALVGLREAIAAARLRSCYPFIEVEVSRTEDALLAAAAGADIIMLDNMSPEQVRATIRALRKEGVREKVTIEVSGGIDTRSVARYATAGADVISIGALTHSVRNIAVHLDITGRS